MFPGARTSDRPMSDGTINAALRRFDYGNNEHVAYGFLAMAIAMMAERLSGMPHALLRLKRGLSLLRHITYFWRRDDATKNFFHKHKHKH